jgi:hypothetical protein
MKTFLGFTTGLLGGAIGGIMIVWAVAFESPEFREAFIKTTKPDNAERPKRSDYAVEVEDLND